MLVKMSASLSTHFFVLEMKLHITIIVGTDYVKET